MNYKVYGLVNPNTKQIFYVGMTCNNPNVRVAQHFFSSGVVSKYVQQEGIIPEIILLAEGLTRKQAISVEKDEIVKRNGTLINIRPLNRQKDEHPKHRQVDSNAKKVKAQLVEKWKLLFDNGDIEKIRKGTSFSRWEIKRAIFDGYFNEVEVVVAVDKFYAEKEMLLSQYMD